MNNIGYDELFADRVKQLREIDERLERLAHLKFDYDGFKMAEGIDSLRRDIAVMVAKAEAEHEAF